MTPNYQQGKSTRTYDKAEKGLVLHLIQLKWMFKTVSSDHIFNLSAFFLECSFVKMLLNSYKLFKKYGTTIQIPLSLLSLLCRTLLFQIKNIWH